MGFGSLVTSTVVLVVTVFTVTSSAFAGHRSVEDPSQHEYYAKIAESHIQRQDYLKASQYFEKFIDEPDVNAEYYLRYGQVLKSLRLYAKAKFYFQKYAAFYPAEGNHFVESCDLARMEIKGKEFYEVDLSQVASFGTEFGPVVIDEDLVFNSLSSDNQASDVAVNRLYSSKEMGARSVNKAAGADILPSDASHIRFSENGSWLGYHTHGFAKGMRLFSDRPGSFQLYVGKASSKNTLASVEAFPYNSDDYSVGYPSFSPDGSVLYFASDMPGGEGGWDLYVSFRSRDGWTKPQNLGPTINSKGNEIAPYYQDQKLYFSSDWHKGLGGFDIFKATSTDGQWSNVRSMGYPLNSPKDDLDFYIDQSGETGFFVSNRVGGPGEYDIYSFTTRYDEVLLTVRDQDGEMPVSGAVIMYDDSSVPPSVTDENGMAVIHHPYEGTREVTIAHKDYRTLTMTLRANKGRKPSKYDVFIDRSLGVNNVTAVESNEDKVGTDIPSDDREFPDMMRPRNVDAQPSKANEDFAPEPVVETKTIVVATPEAVDKKLAEEEPVNIYPTAGETTTGYAIQVAAIGSAANLGNYSALKSFGEVIGHEENGLVKVRIGYFPTRANANKALTGIKNTGYADAFIVSTDVPANRSVAGMSSGKSTVNPMQSKNSTTIASEDYFVRLGTYSRPEFFDHTTVQDLGRVVRRKKGDLTIMLLSGYGTFAEAEKARKSAAERGFGDCYVAVERDGSFVKAK